jgi:hypothetical protein
MSLRWMFVALFLTIISGPASLIAAGNLSDGNSGGPPPIVHPTLPPDGNPWPH